MWGCGFQNVREEPIHILNVAVRWADHQEDEELVPIFRAFAQSKVCSHDTLASSPGLLGPRPG